jgi:hypothetical protein
MTYRDKEVVGVFVRFSLLRFRRGDAVWGVYRSEKGTPLLYASAEAA